MKVLWLASWYPGRTHATNGDFTERQAVAVSRLLPVTVLFVTKDEALPAGKVQLEKTSDGNLTVYRVYYGSGLPGGWAGRLLSLWRYRRVQRQYIRLIMQEQGRPDAVHVQVAMKAGLGALYLKKKHGIPYVVTEHWTGYYPQSSDSLYSRNALFRQLNKKVLQQAAAFLPVSAHLGQTVNDHFLKIPFTAIPNVVDTTLFNYHPAPQGRFRFIHPSYLNYQKNPEGILEACRIAAEAGADFEVLFVGRLDAALAAKAESMGLGGIVVFMDEVNYAGVARLMQASSALLLFSRFENLPCVVLEALCCGLPVISTNVGGLPEVIDSSNGLLVASEDTAALAAAMQKLQQQYTACNRSAIAGQAAARYGFSTVAGQYADVYKKITAHT